MGKIFEAVRWFWRRAFWFRFFLRALVIFPVMHWGQRLRQPFVKILIAGGLGFFYCGLMRHITDAESTGALELIYCVLVMYAWPYALHYLYENLRASVFFMRAGDQREILESGMDSRLDGDVLKNPYQAEAQSARFRFVAEGVLLGFTVVLASVAFLPGLRGLYALIPWGWANIGFQLVSLGLLLGIVGDICGKNLAWGKTLVSWKGKQAIQPVTLPPPPVSAAAASGKAQENGLCLVVGEQHAANGDRIANPTWFTLREKALFTSILVVGDTGSGKTTGLGYPWVETLVKSGLGGLILDGNGSYVNFARRLMAAAGRENDLVVLEPGGPWKYNPVFKPQMSSADLAAWIFNVIGNLSPTMGRSSTEAFWEQAGTEYALTILELLRLNDDKEHVSLDMVYRLNTDEANRNAILESLKAELAQPIPEERAHRISHLLHFYGNQWASYSPQLKGSIPAQLNSVTSMFSQDYEINRTFCPRTGDPYVFNGFDNDFLDSGKVVVLNMPAHDETGRTIGIFLKLDFQRAVLKRAAGKSQFQGRPVFLLIDEAQNYVSASQKVGDAIYLAEARKSRPINIYMSQNGDSFLNAFREESTCNVFFANLRTKIFLSQEQSTSQKTAAELCGKGTVFKKTISESEAGRDTEMNYMAGGLTHEKSAASKTVSYQEQDDYIFKPQDFRRLPVNVAVVSPFDGSQKLLPRVVYTKPVFVDDEGNVIHRETESWFAKFPEFRSYRDASHEERRQA